MVYFDIKKKNVLFTDLGKSSLSSSAGPRKIFDKGLFGLIDIKETIKVIH